MDDDVKADVEIYQYFSECLKHFRKKMTLICKVSNLGTGEINPHLQSNFNQISKEGISLYKKFEQFLPNAAKIQPIFARFLLRIKQSVHAFLLKISDIDIANFLKFIDRLIKQYNITLDMKLLIKPLLTNVPKSIQSILYFDENIATKSQNFHSIENIELKNNFTSTKSQSFGFYDKYLQALDRQYRLFDCLNIQESHYRRSFFLALQDIHRKDCNLYEEMLSRNRYAKQTLEYYQRQFDINRKKTLQKRQKLLKTQTQTFLGQLKSKKINTNVVVVYNQKLDKNSLDKNHVSAPKRVKTVYNSTIKRQNDSSPKQSLFGSFNQLQSINTRNKLRDTSQAFPQVSRSTSKRQNLLIKTKINQSEGNAFKNMNIMQLKKVQFRGTRIELGPQEIQKKTPTLKQEDRKKVLNNRAQQHFRKKISFITQPKSRKQYSFKTQASPDRQKKFNSIRINFCRYEN